MEWVGPVIPVAVDVVDDEACDAAARAEAAPASVAATDPWLLLLPAVVMVDVLRRLRGGRTPSPDVADACNPSEAWNAVPVDAFVEEDAVAAAVAVVDRALVRCLRLCPRSCSRFFLLALDLPTDGGDTMRSMRIHSSILRFSSR